MQKPVFSLRSFGHLSRNSERNSSEVILAETIFTSLPFRAL